MKICEPKFLDITFALERADKARKSIDPNKIPKYHLDYLDSCLGGIAPSELIVIGADTGIGKTHFANHIAKENAFKGQNVYLFSLEGHEDEVINRWKWQIICREYYKNPNGKDMMYGFYEMNSIDGLEEYEKIATEEILQLNNYLHIFDRSVGLNIQVLTNQLSLIKEADLVIIDHLHYFDMFEDKSEAQNISEIMKNIKLLTETKKIPVILVSHLRKKDRYRGLPDNEDFMGSSNIAKIATTCILINSNPENHNLVEGEYSTIIRVSKSRSGASTTLACEAMFNSRKNIYNPGYKLGRVINGDYKELEFYQYPKWAKVKGDEWTGTKWKSADFAAQNES